MDEFKFSNDNHVTRLRFLSKIHSFDMILGTVVVMKDSVREDLKGGDKCSV